MDSTSRIVFCVVTCLALSAASAFLITQMWATGSFLVIFLCCAAGSGILAAFFGKMEFPISALLCAVLVSAALILLPVLERLGVSKRINYTVAAACIIGLGSSRFVHKMD